MKRFLIPVSAGCMIASLGLAHDCSNLAGTWKSEAGTTLNIDSVNLETGTLNGTFKSPDNLFSDGPFPVNGIFGAASEPSESSQGTTITFNVKWPGGSVSSWTGICLSEQTGSRMNLLWQQASPTASKPIFHINSGSTSFLPVN